MSYKAEGNTRVVKVRKEHVCVLCFRPITKGELSRFSEESHFFEDDDGKSCVFKNRLHRHVRCFWRDVFHSERFCGFQERCCHPAEFIEWHYVYLPGDSVPVPDYKTCGLCFQVC